MPGSGARLTRPPVGADMQRNGVDGSFTPVDVSCKGSAGAVFLAENGDFTFKPAQTTAAVTFIPWLRYCFQKPIMQVIPSQQLIGASLEAQNCVRIWYCQPHQSGSGKSRRVQYKLKKTSRYECTSREAAEKLVNQVQRASSWWGRSTPQHIMAVVNPISGKGNSCKLFNEALLPMLRDAAGMNVTIHQTTGPGHATQVIQSLNLNNVDLVVYVGGDGTVFEGVQGLISRPDWTAACSVPFAAVPGGSGNGLAASCGLWDPITAAYSICKGHTHALDMATVLQPPNRRYLAFLSVVFGLMGNLDIGTESLRWMGEARFTVGAVREVLRCKPYSMRLAVWPEQTAAGSVLNGMKQGTMSLFTPTPLDQSTTTTTSDSHTLNDTLLQSGHATSCSEATMAHVTPPASNSQPHCQVSDFPQGPPLPILSQLPSISSAISSWPSQLPVGWQLLPHTDLQFFALYNTPYIALHALSNPKGSLHSGSWDLHIMRGLEGLTGRLKLAQAMLKLEEGTHVDLQYLHSAKVGALMMQPLCNDTWTVVDGEAVPNQTLLMEVHKGLCKVLVAPTFPGASRPSEEV